MEQPTVEWMTGYQLQTFILATQRLKLESISSYTNTELKKNPSLTCYQHDVVMAQKILTVNA